MAVVLIVIMVMTVIVMFDRAAASPRRRRVQRPAQVSRLAQEAPALDPDQPRADQRDQP